MGLNVWSLSEVELLQFLTLNLCGFDPGLKAGSNEAIKSNLVISLVPYEEAKKNKNKKQQKAFIYQNCLRIFAHFQWMRGEKVPRESKKCPGTLWGFSSIFVRAHKDSSRCCQAESLGLLPLSPPSLLFLSSLCTKVNFSSCQRNLRKTFQIDGMITLISKRPWFFPC